MNISIQQMLKARSQVDAEVPQIAHICLYGYTGSGKTTLGATLCRLPGLGRMVWFDLDNGFGSVISLPKLSDPDSGEFEFTPEELSKIELVKLKSTIQIPRGIETLKHAFNSQRPLSICYAHGQIMDTRLGLACAKCNKSNPEEVMQFHLAGLGPNDLVVIDSGTQLGNAALALSMLENDFTILPQYYGAATNHLLDVMSEIQAAQTNVLLLTHVYEECTKTGELIRLWPNMLSSGFSPKVGNYFNQVGYCHSSYGNYKVGTGPGYMPKVFTNSNTSIRLEDYPHADLTYLLFPALARKKLQEIKAAPASKKSKISINL